MQKRNSRLSSLPSTPSTTLRAFGNRGRQTMSLSKGFTIIELLVVIVIIAVLATLVLVAYRGIQSQAAITSLKSDLSNASTRLGVDIGTDGHYPATEAEANGGKGLSKSPGTVFSYTMTAGEYCLSATSVKAGTAVFHVTSTNGSIENGNCLVITNLVTNPSAESGIITPNEGYYTPTIVVDSSTAAFGTKSIKLTTNSIVNNQGLMWKVPTAYPNIQYTCSVSIKGTNGKIVNVSGRAHSASGYIGEGYDAKNITLSASWQRVSVTFTSPALTASVFIQYRQTLAESGVNIWGDGAMCTQGSSVYNYADGSSPSWVWNGAANNSTSTGPPL